MVKIFAGLLLAGLSTGAGLLAGPRLPAAHAAAAHRPPRGNFRIRRVDVGGYKLYLQCRGHGALTVLYEAGAGADSSAWGQVLPPPTLQPEESGPATVQYCAYDRAGEGQSDPSPHPRDAATIVRELHTLLTNARIAPPYILVGHSIGGVYITQYAFTYQREVAGLVFVDGNHWDGWAADQAVFGGDPSACTAKTTFCGEASAWRRDQVEGDAASRRLGAHPLGNRPVVVLVATQKEQPGLGLWLRWQGALAQLSTNSRLLRDPLSHHDIADDQPPFVIEAVQRVVAAVRRHSALPPVMAWRCGDGSGVCR
jgi:pimeloyl-ACP methyl ester carboxylesterase